ncbi:MAG: DNA polymerase III subunit beta [Acholeplasmataceae bacterium]|jgi:DNA polymerase-3 subunit beta|nr:DNA polymerase III subunit beta [Acholeplasmataceae bacterium]
MNFQINRNILLNNLLIAQRGLPNKTPLPVLNAIKIEVNPDHLILTTSNSDLAIQVLVDDESLKVVQTGKIAIPGKFLIEIVRKIDSNLIEFSLVDNKIVTIKADRSEFNLRLMDVLDYPEVDFLENNEPIELDSEIIKSIISETNFATANNEKRPILTGVHFSNVDNNLIAVSTDSYRLSQKRLQLRNQPSDFNFVIPSKSLDELSRILDIASDNIQIFSTSNKVLFKFPNILFQTRLLEGKYPDTERIIPVDFPIIIPFNKEELLSAVERVALLSPKDRETNYNIIRLTLRPDKIVEISSTNTEVGDALEEVIPTSEVKGTTLRISFSSKYLIEALKSFRSPEIIISFAGDVKPFVLTGSRDIGLLHLILPVRID